VPKFGSVRFGNFFVEPRTELHVQFGTLGELEPELGIWFGQFGWRSGVQRAFDPKHHDFSEPDREKMFSSTKSLHFELNLPFGLGSSV
jgi:hypothetical protein